MKRRTLLHAGAFFGAATVAGCLGAGDGPGGDPGDDTDGSGTTTEEPDTSGGTTTDPGTSGSTTTDDPAKTDDPGTTDEDGDDFFGIDSRYDSPHATFEFGSDEEVIDADHVSPPVIDVWNDADEERTFRVVFETEGGPTFDRSVALPADAYLRVTPQWPADYDLRVSLDGEVVFEDEVLIDFFDCNSTGTDVSVRADGTTESVSGSTLQACPPTVVTTSFDHDEGSCGTGDEASVTFEDGQVAVEGVLEVPTPCHGGEFLGVEHGEGHGLAVRVGAVDPPDGTVCKECVGQVPYTATATVIGRRPDTVSVVHESTGGTRTVATWTRSAD